MAMVGKATKNLSSQQADEKQIIGSTAFVNIAGHYKKIPAKIDTGADSSSIWASNINVDSQGNLTFSLFAPSSPFYDGCIFTYRKGEYAAASIYPSTGEESIRYRVTIPIILGKHKIRASFTLADRKNNALPILIGRRTILGKFLVDVSKNPTNRRPSHTKRSEELTRKLNNDPQKFHQRYINGEEK